MRQARWKPWGVVTVWQRAAGSCSLLMHRWRRGEQSRCGVGCSSVNHNVHLTTSKCGFQLRFSGFGAQILKLRTGQRTMDHSAYCIVVIDAHAAHNDSFVPRLCQDKTNAVPCEWLIMTSVLQCYKSCMQGVTCEAKKPSAGFISSAH
jgi:hypothetical protein